MKAVRLLQGLLIITCIIVPTRLYRNIGRKNVTPNGELIIKSEEIVIRSGKDDKDKLAVNRDGEVKFQVTKTLIDTVASVDEVKPTNSSSTTKNTRLSASVTSTTRTPAKTINTIKKSQITKELEFRKFKIPIVIFCSYRPTYMARLLNSMKSLEGLNPDTVCLFACQRTPRVSTQDIVKTQNIINNVKICKAKSFLTESRKRNAKEYKKQWYNVVKLAFENPGYKYQKDVLFLEDDIELSKDALKAVWFMLNVKNSNPNTIAVGLGGWSGEHLVNPYPDSFVIRVMLYFPGMAYSFNASIWKAIKQSKFLASKTNDWSEAIAWMWPGRHNVVVPTLGRMWHIGERGLGKSGDGRKKRILQAKPGWLVSPRLMNLNNAFVNGGIRDIFGMYCERKHWRKHLTVPCLCPTTKAVYPNKKHFSVVCVDNPIVYDKCIGRDA